MPEICEAELISRELDRLLKGCTVTGVDHASWYLKKRSDENHLLTQLHGWTVSSIERRAKAILFKFENPGIGSKLLLSRLGMTGVWRLAKDGFREISSYVCALRFYINSQDVWLVYQDKRKFGSLEVQDSEREFDCLKQFGPDVLGGAFTPEWVLFCVNKHRAPIKALLMRPEYFSGVGNWVANEALFRANIHPEIPGKEITEGMAHRLVKALLITIHNGIAQGGATLKDWEDPDGRQGSAQEFFNVYGRDGKQCKICLSKIIKIKIAGRGTYYCPDCQIKDWSPKISVSESFVQNVVSLIGEDIEEA